MVHPGNCLFRYFSSARKLKKSLGQHFLKDNTILQKIVSNATIQDKDIILEIGPGSGQLTRKLLQYPVHVIAVEKDASLISGLHQQFQSFVKKGQLSIIEGDILTVDLPMYTRCIANIPYYISSPLLQRFVLEKQIFQEYILLVQKEFCSKLCSIGDHESTFITVFLQSFFTITPLLDVSPFCFTPPPKVVSTVMKLSPCVDPSSTTPYVTDCKQYMAFLKSLFSTKNKTVSQSLNRMYPNVLPTIPTFIDLSKKVYQLSASDCCTLFTTLYPFLSPLCSNKQK